MVSTNNKNAAYLLLQKFRHVYPIESNNNENNDENKNENQNENTVHESYVHSVHSVHNSNVRTICDSIDCPTISWIKNTYSESKTTISCFTNIDIEIGEIMEDVWQYRKIDKTYIIDKNEKENEKSIKYKSENKGDDKDQNNNENSYDIENKEKNGDEDNSKSSNNITTNTNINTNNNTSINTHAFTVINTNTTTTNTNNTATKTYKYTTKTNTTNTHSHTYTHTDTHTDSAWYNLLPLFHPSLLLRTSLGFGINIFFMMTGYKSIMYYSSILFRDIGLQPILVAAITGGLFL